MSDTDGFGIEIVSDDILIEGNTVSTSSATIDNDSRQRVHNPLLNPPRTNSRPMARNYKCPECGGEFNQWHTPGGIRPSRQVKEQCPFCGLVKGEYDAE